MLNLSRQFLYKHFKPAYHQYYLITEFPMLINCLIMGILPNKLLIIRRRGVVGRVPAFQLGGPGSIPDGVRNFNFCPGIGCVSFVCVCPVLSSAEALALC